MTQTNSTESVEQLVMANPEFDWGPPSLARARKLGKAIAVAVITIAVASLVALLLWTYRTS